MNKNIRDWKNTGPSRHQLLMFFGLGLLALALSFCWARPAEAQYNFYLRDYHFRAGDGGKAVNTVDEGTLKAWGTEVFSNYFASNWVPKLLTPDAITAADPGCAAGGTYSGSGTLGELNGAFDGRVALDGGQASASGGQGGNVVIDLSGKTIRNNRGDMNGAIELQKPAARYFFTAGNGNSDGNGGDIKIFGDNFTIGDYSLFFLQSGADGGGHKGGGISFSADSLTLGGSGQGGSSLYFTQTTGGGQAETKINDLYVNGQSSISYDGTSARYNTIGNINFRLQSSLTFYGKAGNRYNDALPGEFNNGNYTADGAHINIDTGAYGIPAYFNIQAGAISAKSIDFMQLHSSFKLNPDGSVNKASLYINNPANTSSSPFVTPPNPNLPDLLAGETSLGVLDLTGLDKNDIYFNFISADPGDTYCLIRGNWGADGTYLLGDDYGVFARQFGAQRYLFDLDASSGDMLLTFLGLDGGFTHYIKSYFEGRAAEATTVIAGGQFVADSIIANARLKAKLNETTSSLSIGASKIKTQTGSYVENDNYNAAVSGAYLFEAGPGLMLFGAFVEAGRGNYDYYHSYKPTAPQSNDGKSNYYGGGAFARYEFPLNKWNGFYAEASARTGKIDNEFNGMFGAEKVTYENRSSYYGAHFGFGKVFDLTEQSSLDLYAKGFYNAVESGGVMTSAKENLDFDRVESITTRLGGRLTHQFSDRFVVYAGGAWEKEHNGRVDGTYLGKDYDFGTSLKGDSAIGEIGLNLQPLTIPLSVELSAFGKGGQQEGYGGSVSIKYTYQ